MEHPSDEARKDYLKEHPKADPSNHTVLKQEEPKAPSEEPKNPTEEVVEPKPSSGAKAKNFLRGLSSKAQAFIASSSAEAQKFIADSDHRKKTLVSAAKAIKGSPKTYAQRILETAKHEVHEFKEAGEGVGAVIKGGKMTPKQKKAVRTVAIHMGIAVAAAALTSTGVLAGAAALGKGLAQKIALKAAARALENIHLAQEVSHIGHGSHALVHLFTAATKDKAARVSPEEVLAILVTQSVTKELENFSDEDLVATLEESSGQENQKMASAKIDQLEPALESMRATLGKIPVKEFDRILVAARAESETLVGRVWQKRFMPYFDGIDDTVRELEAFKEDLNHIEVVYSVQLLTELIWQALKAVDIPRKASTDYAISNIEFNLNPTTQREEISYSIPVLREWNKELEKWVKDAQTTLKTLVPKVRRIIKTKALV